MSLGFLIDVNDHLLKNMIFINFLRDSLLWKMSRNEVGFNEFNYMYEIYEAL